jgi:RNA polymerase sigma-70 factor (ECF subfamily)
VDAIKPLVETAAVVAAGSVPAHVAASLAVAYDRHASAVYGMALRSTRDPELAADVTQEAFLRLMVEVQHGRGPDNVGAWLYRASSNLIVSRARRAAVARRFAPRLLRRDTPDQPEDVALGNERQGHLEYALASLSVSDRIALLMAAQGATGAEIAAHLGRSHGATRTLLVRARRRLRDAMVEREARR